MKRFIIITILICLALTSCVAVVDVEEKINDTKEELSENTDITGDSSVAQETDEKNESENDKIIPDENETEAVEGNFKIVTEEELQEILDAITGGESVEFPMVPIE